MLFQRLESPKTFGDFLPTLSTGKRRTARIMASRLESAKRMENGDRMEPAQVPSGNLMKNGGSFHCYVSLPEGNHHYGGSNHHYDYDIGDF